MSHIPHHLIPLLEYNTELSSYKIPTHYLYSQIGFFDYNASSALSAIPAFSGSQIIANDTLGQYTLTSYGPDGVTKIWNPSLTSFDFSELNIGDMVDIRLDLTLTNNINNQQYSTKLYLGVGTPSEFSINWGPAVQYKTQSDHDYTVFNGVYMGSNDILTGGGYFELTTDDGGTYTVNGFYCKVIKR